MALNYSHRPIFSARMPEDNLVHGGSQERDNIHDILPADPFGMDISSTVTAITGWLEDLGVSDYGGDDVGVGKGHYPVLGGLNVWWDTAVDFQPYLGENKTFNTMFRSDRFVNNGCVSYGCCCCCTTENDAFGSSGGGGYAHESGKVLSQGNVGYGFDDFFSKHDFDHGGETMKDAIFYCSGTSVYENHGGETMKDAIFCRGGTSVYEKDDFHHHGGETMKDVIFCRGGTSVYEKGSEEVCVGGGVEEEEDDGSPHPALSFALAYLGVRDLVVVERVCKSLQFTVLNDPLLWKSIHIDYPLNSRVTDDVLVQLTNRAQGHLQCLSLVDCKGVTNDGLRRVLESNPRLTKLSVPGCINLKIEGMINCLKAFQPRAVTGIKCLRVAGRIVTLEQYEELLLLLGIHNHVQSYHQKPLFYCRGNVDLSCEDDRPIDLEICPKCKMAKLVYDCTTESCQAKDQAGHLCRACIQCIYRCYQCGRCIDGVVHEEDFFLDYVCSDCSPGHDIAGNSSKHDVSYELDG
ncbi:F-box protein SKIP14 [Silene latifolia]|uniref:F-box protein SKIP14 n=1 Tax=Silene latifolia TaxID=37657 RepID=UPI003D76B919